MDLLDSKDFIEEITNGGLSFFCSEHAFVKTSFFEIIYNSSVHPVFYFDFDMLFSGYLTAKIIQTKNNKITIIHPNRHDWNNMLSEVLGKISLQKSIVIIDSLNGFVTLFDDIESSKFVNSCIMLLDAIGSNTSSSILVGAIAKFKKDEGWFLVPTSRRIAWSKNSTICSLKESSTHITVDKIEKTLTSKSCKVFIKKTK